MRLFNSCYTVSLGCCDGIPLERVILIQAPDGVAMWLDNREITTVSLTIRIRTIETVAGSGSRLTEQ